jgi:hypothetical protein
VEIRERLKTLAGQRRRFGCRRLHILLRRDGIALNHKKLFRLYREERLTVRRRGGRKRALGTRAPMTMPQGPNQRWTSTLSRISSSMAAASASWSSSTTLRESAWRSSSTPRSPASASSGSSMHSSPFAAGHSWWSATTAPS